MIWLIPPRLFPPPTVDSIDIRGALEAALHADPTLQSLTAGNIAESSLGTYDVYPGLVYQVIIGTPISGLTGNTTVREDRVQFDAWAYDGGVIQLIRDRLLALYDCKQQYGLTPVWVVASRKLEEADGREPPVADGDRWVYRLRSDYAFRWKPAPA